MQRDLACVAEHQAQRVLLCAVRIARGQNLDDADVFEGKLIDLGAAERRSRAGTASRPLVASSSVCVLGLRDIAVHPTATAASPMMSAPSLAQSGTSPRFPAANGSAIAITPPATNQAPKSQRQPGVS